MMPTGSRRPASLLPGVLACVGLGALAAAVGALVPVVGGPVVGIVLGVVVRELVGTRPRWRPGQTFVARRVLQGSVVLLGAGMSLTAVTRTGLATLPVMLGTLAVALVGGRVLGRRLGVEREVRTLVTCGTAICGASAIAAVSAAVAASEAAVAYSVSVIFVFNVLGAVLFPLLGHVLGLGQHAFGVWAGTAVNDTSSVVAAGTTYGPVAAATAVVVKLCRTLMIVPVALAEAVSHHRRHAQGTRPPAHRLVPGFLVLFLVATSANSAGLVPTGALGPLHELAVVGTTVAMTAVGLSTDAGAVRRAGWRPLLLGGSLWVLVAGTSLALQGVTGQL